MRRKKRIVWFVFFLKKEEEQNIKPIKWRTILPAKDVDENGLDVGIGANQSESSLNVFLFDSDFNHK